MKKITRVDLANIFLVAVSGALLVNVVLIAVYGGVLVNGTLLIKGDALELALDSLMLIGFIAFGLGNIRRENKHYLKARLGIGVPIRRLK